MEDEAPLTPSNDNGSASSPRSDNNAEFNYWHEEINGTGEFPSDLSKDEYYTLKYKPSDVTVIKSIMKNNECVHCGYGGTRYDICQLGEHICLISYFICSSYTRSDSFEIRWVGDSVDDIPQEFLDLMEEDDEEKID